MRVFVLLAAALLVLACADTPAPNGVILNDLAPADIKKKTLVTQGPWAAFESYSAYIRLHHNCTKYGFFQLFMGDAQDLPMMYWTNGGPGAGSLQGAYTENIAPLTLDLNMSLFGHLLVIDHPIGIGFSYSDCPARTEEENAIDYVAMLDAIYSAYSLFGLDSYFAGESYGGRYQPAIATQMLADGGNRFHLAGLMMGNPLIDPALQAKPFASVCYVFGLCDENEAAILADLAVAVESAVDQEDFHNASAYLNEIFDKGVEFGAKFFVEDIRLYRSPTPSTVPWLNSTASKNALHADPAREYNAGNGAIGKLFYDDIGRSSLQQVVTLLVHHNIKILIYEGQMDWNIPSVTSSYLLWNLPWPQQGAWRQAKKMHWCDQRNNIPAGFAKNVDRLWFVQVNGAGHLVPKQQPRNTFDMYTRFINEESYATCKNR